MHQDLRIPKHLHGSFNYHHFRGQQMTLRHTHDELEFNLVMRGNGAYLLGDRTYTLQRYDLVWLFPGQEHILIEQSPDYEMWVAVFRPELVRATCTGVPGAEALCENDPEGWFCRRLAMPQASRLDILYAEILASRDDQWRHNAGLAYSLLATWSAFSSGEEIPAGAVIHPAVEQAVLILRRDHDTIDFASLAKRCGLSSGRLSRLFKEQMGVPLVEFRNRLRLERVLAEHRNGEHATLLDAALSAGFGSYPQFHRVFSRAFGCSPAKFFRTHAGGAGKPA